MSSITSVNYVTLLVVFASLGFVVYRFLSALVRVGKSGLGFGFLALLFPPDLKKTLDRAEEPL